MNKNDDWIRALEETAGNLKHQAQILREQSADLSKESATIRAAVRKARKKRNNKQNNKKIR